MDEHLQALPLVQAYEQSLSFPYCSVTPVYQVAGYDTPPEFGDNCVSQAENIANAIRQIDGVADVRYLVDGRHHAVICSFNGQCYLFDPYLLHVEPVNVEYVKTLTEPYRIDAYPFYSGVSGLKKSWLGISIPYDQVILLKKGRFNPLKDSISVSAFTLPLNQASISRTPKDDPSIAFAEEQTTLSIRSLNIESGSTVHIVYPIHETHPYGIVDIDRLYIKNKCSRVVLRLNKDYRDELLEMANGLGVQPSEIEDFIMDGVSLYEKLAPSEIDYQSFNPTNQ